MNLRNGGSRIVILSVVLALAGCKGVDDSSKKLAAAAVVTSSVNVLKSMLSQEQAPQEPSSQTPEQKGGQVFGGSQSAAMSSASTVAPDPESEKLAKGPFSGITIIEQDSSGSGGGVVASPIVIFVSPEGHFASSSGAYNGTGCIGWVTDPKTNPAVLTFGFPDPSATETYRNAGAYVCPSFTVQFESATTVRVISGQYNRQRNMITRVPLNKIPDWSADIFEKHAIKGTRLGPVTTGIKRPVPFDPAVMKGRPFLHFEMPVSSKSGRSGYERPIFGQVIYGEGMGWQSDILTHAWYDGNLDQSGPGAVFNKAIHNKYGSPSFMSGGFAIWLYDLEGKKLETKDANPFNCLGNYKTWERQFKSRPIIVPGDLGPWGCSLMMRHTYADDNAVIGSYGVDIASGVTMAMVHFRTRLGEVAMVKEKIAKLQQFKPQF